MEAIKFFLKKRVINLVLTASLFIGGLLAYFDMSRLEDPEFTIKEALVITPYPGASAEEVEQEITDEIEIAVQRLGQIDEVESRSERDLSTVTVTIKEQYDKNTLPQVWDELRRKVHDAQSSLPPNAGPSIVLDDYGDVFGVLLVLYGEDYSHAELKEVSDLLRRELLLVTDVAKVETFGERQEAVYVELDRERLASLGIDPAQIIQELQFKNLVAGAGSVRVGDSFVPLQPDGTFTSVAQFENLLIAAQNGSQFYLGDLGTIRRGYVDPRTEIVHYDGQPAIALGISTVSGGNVMTMGDALQARLAELESEIPLGMEIGTISMQSVAVETAINGFISSLIQAVGIVILVLLLFMGLRSGLLIGVVLIITIVGSFLILKPMGVALERVSLGALIIALGMLVDNAIVIVDGILVRLQRGKKAFDAAFEVVRQSAIPLLGATLIAILAFAAIGASKDSTGEFTRSLFQVIAVSLLLSWVTAVTTTPLLAMMFLPIPKDTTRDPYASPFYQGYKWFLEACLRRRWTTVGVIGLLFVVSVGGFGFVKQAFFPPATRPQFIVDFWQPQGTHIDATEAEAGRLAAIVREMDGVETVSTVVGQGAPRFLLTYAPEMPNAAFSQLLVDVDDAKYIDRLIPAIEGRIRREFPDALGFAYRFELGPGAIGKVQARFAGPEASVLRELGDQALAIMRGEPEARAPRTDWRQPVKVIRPQLIEEQANALGIDYADVSRVIRHAFEGQPVGVYRESDLLLPIIMRAPERERAEVESLHSLQIWSPVAQQHVPLRQVVSAFETAEEDSLILRQNRKRTLTVFADPVSITADELLGRLRPAIEAIPLPSGYTLTWEGEYKDTNKAQSALAASVPFFFVLMILITVGLFNSLRQPLVIWACVPLAIVGVTAGLLMTGQPFGFMALLGFLSLSGMLIKNAIVLIDEINVQRNSGVAPYEAIVHSGMSRLRPVALAASTTALGMIPLFFDGFFISMAVTIVFGLICATVLTMVVVPVFHAVLCRAKPVCSEPS